MHLARGLMVCAAGTLLGTGMVYGQPGPAAGGSEDTAELIVFLRPGTDAKQFAAGRGMRIRKTLRSDSDAHVMTAGSAAQARALLNALRTAGPAGGTRAVYLNARRHYVRDAFVPNDPYFHKNTPAAGWPGQWHLINEHTAGLDARVQGAWNRDLTGSGVLIGICDDGLQTAHPDLAPNYVAAHSWDFFGDDSNPNPALADDNHGTAVAGVAAARGGNSIGVTGAAPQASLSGLRLPLSVLDQEAADFVDVILYHSSGADTSIKIKNHSYGKSVGYRIVDAETNALDTSTAAGTIHCWAAGNNMGDANLRDLQNQPGAITVTALGSNGIYSDYSNYGANVFVTAPSNSFELFGITTTDRTTEGDGYNGASDLFPDSNYTSRFGGTSSATPLVAGVLALAKQARPSLDTRFVKHLLARTSDVVDASDATSESDGGWRTNAAGFHFNQRYGFGLIDADELTQEAVAYDGVTTLVTQSTGTIAVNQTLADTGSRTVQFNLSMTQPLEEVLVTIDFETPNAYPVEVNLTAPSGYRTRLVKGSPLLPSEPHTRIAWQYCTNALWGESPAGTWTLKVEDTQADGNLVTWYAYEVTARMGTLSYGNCINPPTNVAASDGTYEYTRVTWTGVSGATHYRVYRATSDSFPLAVPISDWQTGTVYDDHTCPPLTASYYWIRAASDSIGQCGSLPSDSDLGWCKLRPPTGVSASDGVTTAGVLVTWNAAPAATHYCVYRNDVDNPSLAIPISGWQTSLSYLDSSSAASPGVTRYYWVCSAISSSGQASSSFSAGDTGYRRLSPPASVQASQGTYADRVRITWSSVPGASHYRVFRNSEDNPMQAMGLGPWITVTSYDDTTIEAYTYAYYWVQAAVSSTGSRTGDLSAAVTGWRSMPAPTNVSASDGTFTDYCRVTWDPVAVATHYQVWRSTSNEAGTAQAVSSWQTGTTYDDACTPGTVFYYWVTAAPSSGGQGASTLSSSDSGFRKLAAPTNVQASQATYADRVQITWSSVPGASHYRVFRNSEDNPMQAMGIGPWITATSFDDTTVGACSTAYYWVQAAMSSTGSRTSDLSAGVTGWRSMPAPTNVSASDGTSTDYCRVSWGAVNGATHYRVWRSTDSNVASAVNIGTWRTETFYDDTSATRGRIYYYWVVAATDTSGTCASPKSDSFDSGWRGLLPPNCVTASDGDYSDRVYVGWCWSEFDIYHKVYRGPTSDPAQASAITGWIDLTGYEDASGTPGVQYYYFVKSAIAADGTGESGFGLGDPGWRTFAAPGGVAASDGTSTAHVRVTWNPAEAGLWYQVFRGSSSDTRSATAVSAWLADAASFDDTSATVSTTYYYWVKAAIDAAGATMSDFGGPDTGWRAMVGPDASASNRTYVDRVAVSWVGPITGYYYRVYRATTNSSSQAQPLSAWQAARTYNDYTADPGVSYYYWVKISINSAGDYPSAFGRGARGVRALDCNNNGVPDQNDPDGDGDGVPDGCDLCPDTAPGSPVDATGCPPEIPGDFDRDGDVDVLDRDVLSACRSGPAVPRSAGCAGADFDLDLDVDQDDFGVFQRCWSGEDVPGNPACAD